MKSPSRKLIGLSFASLAVAVVHFALAYQLSVTSPSRGLTLAAGLFIVLGLMQTTLSGAGFYAAYKRRGGP